MSSASRPTSPAASATRSATGSTIVATTVSDPPFLRALFSDPRHAWVWLLVRLYVGWSWLEAGIEKTHQAAWVDTGLALKGFWTKAVTIPPPPARPAIAYDWYRAFLEFLLAHDAWTWFAKVIVFSEIAIGIALVLGALVWLAAAGGALLNWNFIMAGTASVNGVLLVLSLALVLAWKIAGWWGVDRWLLGRIGTPWDRSGLFAGRPRGNDAGGTHAGGWKAGTGR